MNPSQHFPPPPVLYYSNYPTAAGPPAAAPATPSLMTVPAATPFVTFQQQPVQHHPMMTTAGVTLPPPGNSPYFNFICNPSGGPGVFQHAASIPPREDPYGPNQLQSFAIPPPPPPSAAAAVAAPPFHPQQLAQPVPIFSPDLHPQAMTLPRFWFSEQPLQQHFATTTASGGGGGGGGGSAACGPFSPTREFAHNTVLTATPLVSTSQSSQGSTSAGGGGSGGGGGTPHNSYFAPALTAIGSASPTQAPLPNVSAAGDVQVLQHAAAPRHAVAHLRQSNGVGLAVGELHHGVVKRFNPSRGYGFIRSEEGVDVFFHQSGVNVGVECPPLSTGNRVTFEVEQDHNAVQAVNVRLAAPAPGAQRRSSAASTNA